MILLRVFSVWLLSQQQHRLSADCFQRLVFQLSPHRGAEDYLQQVTVLSYLAHTEHRGEALSVSGELQLITQTHLCPCQ